MFVDQRIRRWGFSPQTPAKRAFEQNDEEVREFLKNAYPNIKKLAVKEKTSIYWGDEIRVRSDG